MDTPNPDDARPAYLFRSVSQQLLAVSLEASGTNLPQVADDWTMIQEFPLGVHEVVPADVDPEPILRGVRARGFFIWEAGHILPFGTSQ